MSGDQTRSENRRRAADIDVVIVGAGFAGLYALHRARTQGLRAVVLEAGDGVGGTWYWNRYPGARCDVESMVYSYSFDEQLQDEWVWTERYASQPEIRRYLEHVVDRFDLNRDIELGARVVAMNYDEVFDIWDVATANGRRLSARFCVMATGCLSAAKSPELPGADTFAGAAYCTALWPAEPVSFAGQRVAVVGTGSSGVQCIPEIASQASRLFVFQRTANFIIPSRNAPLTPDEQDRVKQSYPELRRRNRNSVFGLDIEIPTQSALEVTDAERQARYEHQWQNSTVWSMQTAFGDLLLDQAANDTVADFVRGKIHGVVSDPIVAEALTPTGHPLGAKRPPLESGYYAAFNRDHVALIDLRSEPIVAVTPGGIRTSKQYYELDSIVYATGFDAMTGALLRIDIRGRNEQRLSEAWANGPWSYLGLAVPGFPNLFTVTGPGSPSVVSNMLVSIEQHVEWIVDCINDIGPDRGTIEARTDAAQTWTEHVREVADATLFPRADSWYVGANVEGKPHGFMPYLGGVAAYRDTCQDVADRGYEGFLVEGAATAERRPA